MAATAKRCPRCETTKPLAEFQILKSGPRQGRVQGYCKRCQNASRNPSPATRERVKTYSKEYYQANRERIAAANREWARRNKDRIAYKRRDRYYRQTYGIGVDEYETLLAAQEGRCAVCGGADQHGRRLAVDHDHGTGTIRGLLCDYCNRAVGLLRDRADIASSMAAYLGGA